MNNLYNQLNPQVNQQLPNNFQQQVINMAKSGGNPIQLLSSMAGQNNQIGQLLNMLNGGVSPKQLFFNVANQQGINPNNILNMFK